jgi:hypothetical protein
MYVSIWKKGCAVAERLDLRDLRQSDLVALLNASRVVADRRAAGMAADRAKATSTATVRGWTQEGLPKQRNSRLDLVEVAAWLACARKDGAGRPSVAARAQAGRGEGGGLSAEELTERIRQHVDPEAGVDVVGLLSVLLGEGVDLEAAEACAKIVKSLVDSEKGRTKALADEYRRRLQAGELVEAEEVESGRVARAAFTREVVEGLPSQATRLTGLSGPEMRETLREISDEMLRRLSGTDGTDAASE